MLTLSEINNKVKEYFAAETFTGIPRQLYEPIDYTLAQGGKRIRPAMLLAATQMFGGDLETARYAAIGIETFHNFTLLHDDLMDQSPMRRGKPTVYRKWDENTAILSGDAMNILAWRYFLRTPHHNLHRILQTFEKTSMEICEGQQYDMNFETQNDVTIEEYMEMIRLKTAVMLGGALKIGALYADAPDNDIELLYDFGIKIGLAFQLRDDLLDVYGDTATFGKQTGTDIRDNKKTFLLLSAIKKASQQQKERLQNLFAVSPNDTTAKVNEVIDIYNALNIRHDVEKAINNLHNEALSKLGLIAQPESDKAPLYELTKQLLNRQI